MNGHFAISRDLKRLDLLGFKSKYINFNLTNKNIPASKDFGNKIYIYNGPKPGREDIYGKEYYEEVVKRLPEFEYIYSSNLNYNYNDMPKIYRHCFIGLRLTKHDGNANTVQEMGAMGIPVIHNGEHKNSINWEDVDDIELKIRYRNIEVFEKSIAKFKKILFICSDYPGYGGAATNAMSLINYFGKKKQVDCLFYTNEECNFKKPKNIMIVKKKELQNKLKQLSNNGYDLIILRNYLTFEKKIISCQVYFMIPGIFEPHLDKFYYKIKDKEEMSKYIHKNILVTIKHSDKAFCASYHTKTILEKFYRLHTNILFFNYIDFIGRKYSKLNRIIENMITEL